MNLAVFKELVLNVVKLVITDGQLSLQLAVVGVEGSDAVLKFTTRTLTFLQFDFAVSQTFHKLVAIQHARHVLTDLQQHPSFIDTVNFPQLADCEHKFLSNSRYHIKIKNSPK